jgi:GNAT superfamily N-acetyltransferase
MKKDEVEYLEIKYKFISSTGEIEHCRFINEYNIDIGGYGESSDDIENSQLIGKGKVSLFFFVLAQNEGFSLYKLFDSSQNGLDLGNLLFDWETEDIEEDFKDLIFETGNCNILYVDRVELLPQFRSLGFGKKIMKDILFRFYNSCGLITLKAFPLQLEGSNVLGNDEEWTQKMKYKDLVQDEKVAKKQLYKFYKSLGFMQYLKTEYFYMNPTLINQHLDKINLNEYMGKNSHI